MPIKEDPDKVQILGILKVYFNVRAESTKQIDVFNNMVRTLALAFLGMIQFFYNYL